MCYRINAGLSSFSGGRNTMKPTLRDRLEAGELLAEKLLQFEGAENTIVLGLPRGGIPVAYQVASRLHLPLDVFVVRKLGVPGHEELAMGAVASGGTRVTNEDVVSCLNLSTQEIQAVVERELKELDRREKVYREGRTPIPVRGKTVLLVDDGVATGSTMLAAIEALHKQEAAGIIVAVPTVAAATVPALEEKANEVVAVMAPENFMSVGQWYDDFSQTSDEEVRGYLRKGKDLLAA